MRLRMPRSVRRKTLVLVLVLGAALALAAVAYAGNGGFAPETPHSPNASRINDSYKWISIFTGAIFLLVEGALIWFIIRYRRRGRPRDAEGPQIHAHTRLELIWTAVPVLVLAVIAAFVFYKLPGIQDVPSAKAEGGPLVVRVTAHQFYWQFTYPNGAISIDELHVPVHRTVRVDISSQDVDHSWWIPALDGKFDAIPGKQNHQHFVADRAGTYIGQCGEFCGYEHPHMIARVNAVGGSDFDSWLQQQAQAQKNGTSDLGKQTWTGACATCHGLDAKGGFGPNLIGNPILTQRQAIETLVRNGRNKMPGVGRGWSDVQMKALIAYLKRFSGGSSGGG
jgi:cytochrome c oxidase subunit II